MMRFPLICQRFLGLLLGVVLLAVAGCSGPSEDDQALPAPPQQLARFYSQQLDWQQCPNQQRVLCSTVEVPLDYAQPQGQTLRVAVSRLPAGDSRRRLGSLVLNPGGPGAGAVDMLPTLAMMAQGVSRAASRYDLVAFDPRGVGRSQPVRCLDTAAQDRYLAADPTPDDPAEVAQLQRLNREFGQACLANVGALLGHVSTAEVARDMDILRAALGDKRLNYVGFSYGTFIGASYAEQFSLRVGRMVLDGAVDPAQDAWGFALGQTQGFEQALRAFVTDCLALGAQCPLSGTVEQAQAQVAGLIAHIDAQPLPTGTDRPLTESLATIGIADALYTQQRWPTLREALRQAMTQGDGALLLKASDQYYHRSTSGYTDNSVAAMSAVSCLDRAAGADPATVGARIPQFERASPTFGRYVAWGAIGCTQWPYPPTMAAAPVHAVGAAPILVVGTTGDPATPYAWAQSLAAQLDSGHLLTLVGEGHLALGSGNACIDDAVQNFLLRGVLPTNDRCT